MYIIHHNSSTCTCTCTMISKCWYSVCSSFINNILYSTWVITRATRRRERRVKRSFCLCVCVCVCVRLICTFELTLLSCEILDSLIIKIGYRKSCSLSGKCFTSLSEAAKAHNVAKCCSYKYISFVVKARKQQDK